MSRRPAPAYVITTPGATEGPWRVTPFGNRYATAQLADGRTVSVGVEKSKRVRIAYRGRAWGWRWAGVVRIDGRTVWSGEVAGSVGVRGLLQYAGLVELTPAQATREEERRRFSEQQRAYWASRQPVKGGTR